MIKMSISDIIDRYCIAFLKETRTDEEFSKELDIYSSEFLIYTFKSREVITYFINRLMPVHMAIWDLEANIRKCQEEVLGLEEIGRRALLIRSLNQQRQSIKNEIIDFFDEGFYDCKCNYAFK